MSDRRSLPLSFLDLLFIVLLGLLVITMIKQPIRTTEIERRVEYLIVTTWPDEASSDIDTWFRSPLGERLSYQNDMISVYSLERDDLGHYNDTLTLPDGTRKIVKLNEETIAMRGWIPGEYTVNLHVYAWRDQGPIMATVRLYRVDPYGLLAEQEVELDTSGQEETAFNFTLDGAGELTDISREFSPVRNRSVPQP